jgi:hypothetical protein
LECILIEIYSGEDVLDGLKLQPKLHNTTQKFQSNYGLGHDLDSEAVDESDKPQHVLVFAEKDKRVPNVIPSIPYYIREPLDGKWEINLTILKSGKDLSGLQPEEGLNRKIDGIDGWTELPTQNIVIPFDTSTEDFGIQRFDSGGRRPTYREACVYLLLQFQGIQFVVHARGRLDGKEDVGFRNLHTSKRNGYQVDGYDDATKYFRVVRSTPTRVLGDTVAEPVGRCENDGILVFRTDILT